MTVEYQVTVTQTTVEKYIVRADSWEEAEDLVLSGEINPTSISYDGNQVIDTEEVD